VGGTLFGADGHAVWLADVDGSGHPIDKMGNRLTDGMMAWMVDDLPGSLCRWDAGASLWRQTAQGSGEKPDEVSSEGGVGHRCPPGPAQRGDRFGGWLIRDLVKVMSLMTIPIMQTNFDGGGLSSGRFHVRTAEGDNRSSPVSTLASAESSAEAAYTGGGLSVPFTGGPQVGNLTVWQQLTGGDYVAQVLGVEGTFVGMWGQATYGVAGLPPIQGTQKIYCALSAPLESGNFPWGTSSSHDQFGGNSVPAWGVQDSYAYVPAGDVSPATADGSVNETAYLGAGLFSPRDWATGTGYGNKGWRIARVIISLNCKAPLSNRFQYPP
jgi:hypothetical protein